MSIYKTPGLHLRCCGLTDRKAVAREAQSRCHDLLAYLTDLIKRMIIVLINPSDLVWLSGGNLNWLEFDASYLDLLKVNIDQDEMPRTNSSLCSLPY